MSDKDHQNEGPDKKEKPEEAAPDEADASVSGSSEAPASDDGEQQTDEFGEVVHPNQGWGTDYDGDYAEGDFDSEPDEMSAEPPEDNYTDIEEVDTEASEALSAGSGDGSDFPMDSMDEDFDEALEDDLDLDLDDDDDTEFMTDLPQKKSPLKSVAVFGLIVLAGLTGFAFMNPEVLSSLTGGAEKPVAMQTPAGGTNQTARTEPPSSPAAPAKPAESSQGQDRGAEDDETGVDFAGELPQPTVNENTMARAGEPVPVDGPVPQPPALSSPESSPESSPRSSAGQESETLAQSGAMDEGDDILEQGSTAGGGFSLPSDSDEDAVSENTKQPAGEAPAQTGEQGGTKLAQNSGQTEFSAKPVVTEPEEAAGNDETETFAADMNESSEAVPDTGAALTPRPLPVEDDSSDGATGNGAPGGSSFYDSGDIHSQTLSNRTGPRMMDPRSSPASRLIVIEKNYDMADQEALVVAANRALKLGRYESAVDMFEKLYTKNPSDPRILMGRAIALQKTNRIESAIKTYEELLEADPDNTNALINMLGLLKSQYPSVALRRLIELHNQFPNHPGIAAQVGVTQAELGHYEDAMRFLGIAASIEPDNPMHYMNMAVIADRQMMLNDAIELYQKALQVDAVHGSARELPRDQLYDRLSVLRRRQN